MTNNPKAPMDEQPHVAEFREHFRTVLNAAVDPHSPFRFTMIDAIIEAHEAIIKAHLATVPRESDLRIALHRMYDLARCLEDVALPKLKLIHHFYKGDCRDVDEIEYGDIPIITGHLEAYKNTLDELSHLIKQDEGIAANVIKGETNEPE